jgi:hypothetical protein
MIILKFVALNSLRAFRMSEISAREGVLLSVYRLPIIIYGWYGA